MLQDHYTADPRARHQLGDLIDAYLTTEGAVHRAASHAIRQLVREHPLLIDLIPPVVWNMIYRVRARGTVAP